MDAERAARGGWEAAIDASLAARLLRPAVRPGVSDPAHGRTLAARLQRATAPTLADDVARRYGSAALGGNRPPVVYAAPLPPSAGPPTGVGMEMASAPGAPKAVQREAMDAGAEPALPSARSTPLQAQFYVPRPVVRAAERTPGPVFPPLRAAGAGPAVQRSADPAAALPVVPVRRSAGETRSRIADGAPGHVPGEVSASARPMVVSAATRLRRQIAAEHAEAVPAAPSPMLRVYGRPVVAGGGARAGAEPGTEAGAGRSPMDAIHAAPSAADDRTGTHAADPVRPAQAGIVQRMADPAASPPPRVAGHPVDEATAAASTVHVLSTGGAPGLGDSGDAPDPAAPPMVSAPAPVMRFAGVRDGTMAQAVHPPAARRPPGAAESGGGGSSGSRAVVAAPAGHGTGPVQRMPLRDGAGARSEERVGHVVRATPPPSAVPAEGEGRSAGSRSVVAAHAGRAAGAVQRMALAGAAGTASAGTETRLVHAVPAASTVTDTARAVQRKEATSTPPPGAPSAELPTVTASDARPTGADTARLAEQVYEILVRRLEGERKQRGW